MKRFKYYRNKHSIAGIDPGALWERNRFDMMILVDDDQFVQAPYDEHRFHPGRKNGHTKSWRRMHDHNEMT